MKFAKLVAFLAFSTTAAPALAYDASSLFKPMLFAEEESAYVLFPSMLSGFVAIVPGTIAGIPLSLAGGTITTVTSGDPGAGASAGVFIGAITGYQVVSNVVAVPFWATKAIFYDLPSAAFGSDAEEDSESSYGNSSHPSGTGWSHYSERE